MFDVYIILLHILNSQTIRAALQQLDKCTRIRLCNQLFHKCGGQMLMHRYQRFTNDILTGIEVFFVAVNLFNVAKLNLGCEILLDCFSAFSLQRFVNHLKGMGVMLHLQLCFNLCIVNIIFLTLFHTVRKQYRIIHRML